MTNKRIGLGILAIMLVFGMTVVSCNNDNDTTGGGSNGGVLTVPEWARGDWFAPRPVSAGHYRKIRVTSNQCFEYDINRDIILTVSVTAVSGDTIEFADGIIRLRRTGNNSMQMTKSGVNYSLTN